MILLWLFLLIALFLAVYFLLLQYPLQRIRAFRRRTAALRQAGGVAKRGRAKQLQVSLPVIRDFASSLLLGTSMNATLTQALVRTAEQFKGRERFGQRLQRQVESRLSESPETVLQALAEDFKSEHLADIVRRIEIARQAGAPLVDALAVSVDAIEQDISSSISRDIRDWASKLEIPMIMGIFFSVVVLGILPLILNLFREIGGG